MSYQQEYWKRLKENLPEIYEEKLAKNRIYNKLRLMNETEEEREKRLRKLREYYKEHRGKTAKPRGKATIPTNSLDEIRKYYNRDVSRYRGNKRYQEIENKIKEIEDELYYL